MSNDITSDNEGSLYISDTDANKIHKYSTGTISDWYTEGLNGLLTDGERLLVDESLVAPCALCPVPFILVLHEWSL